MEECISCGRRSENTRGVFCVNEVQEFTPQKEGHGSTTWEITDRQEWRITICENCAAVKYSERLNGQQRRARRGLLLGMLSVLYVCAMVYGIEAWPRVLDVTDN